MESTTSFDAAPDLPPDSGPGVRRSLLDDAGMEWEVWCCVPAAKKGGLTPDYARGWLTFESASGEKRRHAPAPADWRTVSDDSLRILLIAAKPARQRRTA